MSIQTVNKVAFSLMGSIANHMDESKTTNHFLNWHTPSSRRVFYCYNKYISKSFPIMPKPEIHYSVAFGMGFYIAEDGTLMSMPAVTDADGRTTMDVDNEIAVDEWDDPSVYSPSHMMVLAQIMQICTLKRDYVNIGYYAEKFRVTP